MAAPNKWGKEPNEFIHSLKDRHVLISLGNGKSFRGQLIGADPYNLILRQQNGLELMVSKGQMAYIHAVSGGK